MITGRRFLVLLMMGIISILFPIQAAKYTIAVNAGLKTGSWNKFYERCVSSDHMHTVESSVYGRNTSNALKKAHAETGLQYVRGHGIFDGDVAVYSEDANGNAVYSWTNLDKIYDSIVAAGMRPLVEIGFMPNALASAQTFINSVWYNGFDGNWNAPKDWNKWKALIRAFISHLETRYGQAEVENNWLFELWNEPSWMYGGGGGQTGYLTLYDSTAVAFTAQDSLVRLGGPAEGSGGSVTFIPQLIRHCRTYHRKLDFVTYHDYANNNSGGNASTPGMNTFHRGIVDSCRNNNFTGLILNTEWGPSYTQGIAVHDNEQSASFAVKTIHLLNSNDTILYPPPYSYGWWAISDIYEETDNRGASCAFSGCHGLMTRGDSTIPQSWDVAKPAFNAFKLLHRLGTSKLSCTGGTTASPGVNAVATISATNDTVSILVYSHVDGTTGNSATSDSVTLNVTMPAGWTSARMEHWVVDRTHSNSYQTWVGLGSPKTPTAAQWTTIANAAQLAHYDSVATVTITGGVYTKTFTQNYYSVGLIQLSGVSVNSVSPMGKMSDAVVKMTAVQQRNSILLTMSFAGRYTVQLYSANGRKVIDQQITSTGTHSLSLADLPDGVYMLECSGWSQKLVKRVVVAR